MPRGAEHGPPDASYGQVTNPARYAVLHEAARRLLDRLGADYLVDRSDGGPELDPALAADRAVEVVRLRPLADSAGPLTVAFTRFPGLYVRFGEWHIEALPRCGCDACDEQPAALVEELESKVVHLAEGRFSEEIAGLFNKSLSFRFPGSSGWTRIGRESPLHARRSEVHAWQPWTAR